MRGQSDRWRHQGLCETEAGSGPEPRGCSRENRLGSRILCHRNAGNPLAVGECRGYGTKDDFRATAQATVVKIRSLGWTKIEGIVKRMHPILTGEEQERMLQILNVRREQLGKLLGLEE